MNAKSFILLVLLVQICKSDDLSDLINEVFGRKEFNTSSKKGAPKVAKACESGKRCVPKFFCSNMPRSTTYDKPQFDIRIDSNDPEECQFLETCCSPKDIVTVPIVRPSNNPTGCGYRNVDGVGFKIKGAPNDSDFGEFPWMTAILRGRHEFDDNRNIYQCGGSLIHPRIVLTGAHCVYGNPAGFYKVRAGEWETNSKIELYPDQDRLVTNIIIHEDFNSDNLHNDVALLVLESSFDLAPNVNTVCLPPAGFNFDFAKCFATGWGKEQFHDESYQNVLKKVELPMIPTYVCQDNLRQTRLGAYFKLDSSFVCAGGERGKDTCEGDGGSPLVCPIPNTENRYYQAGIVAWGIGCGDENIPGVYVSVANFRNWIDEKLKSLNLEKPYSLGDSYVDLRTGIRESPKNVFIWD